MNPYENMNPALVWLLEHPGVGILFTFLWMLWVAGALGFMCLQLHKHNEREELKVIMQKFEEERRERERMSNLVKAEVPQNPDSRYLGKLKV